MAPRSPTKATSGQLSTRKGSKSPSPVKRKQSFSRSLSPRGKVDRSPTKLSSVARSLHSLDAVKKPPLAPPSQSSTATGFTSDSSPNLSARSMNSPRPPSPSPRPSSAFAGSSSPATARGLPNEKERVRVFVRMRPMRQGEGESTIRLEDESGKRLWLQGERLTGSSADQPAAVGGLLQFDFDGILHADIAQQSVYEAVARPLVDAATTGMQSACLMCYGQTGTGKTYTFGGGECIRVTELKPPSAVERVSPRLEDSKNPRGRAARQQQQQTDAELKAEAKREQKREAEAQRKHLSDQKAKAGVVGRSLKQVLEWAGPRGMRVSIAYVQVYMELLQDLLRPESTLSLREHPDLGVYLDGACWRSVTTVENACAQVAEADARRTTAFTRLNADSSRSHAVLLVSIRNPADSNAAAAAAASDAMLTPPPQLFTTRGGSALSADAEWASARGRLFLVDLAGSERTKRSGAMGERFDEACSINQSLTTLGRCIQALASAKSNSGKKGSGGAMPAPVRESKLTRLLSPCLGGATTSLVCCVSAAAADRYETLSTLEFGRNAMRVQLKPQTLQTVDYKALTIQLQAQLDERVLSRHEIEAEYEERVKDLEKGRRNAEAAKQTAELAHDRKAYAEREAVEKAAEVQATLQELQEMKESAAKTARASHDSRAAIIATADSLAEEVVRARRDRDEALNQLELLSSQISGGPVVGVRPDGGLMMMPKSSNGSGSDRPAEAAKVPEGASAVERECAGAIAELAAYRAQLERRKMRARAAAARGGLGTAGGDRTAAERAVGDRKALQAMRTTMIGAIGGFSELLATCVELTETQHPDQIGLTAEQLTLTEQVRAAQRLVHTLQETVQENTPSAFAGQDYFFDR